MNQTSTYQLNQQMYLKRHQPVLAKSLVFVCFSYLSFYYARGVDPDIAGNNCYGTNSFLLSKRVI